MDSALIGQNSPQTSPSDLIFSNLDKIRTDFTGYIPYIQREIELLKDYSWTESEELAQQAPNSKNEQVVKEEITNYQSGETIGFIQIIKKLNSSVYAYELRFDFNDEYPNIHLRLFFAGCKKIEKIILTFFLLKNSNLSSNHKYKPSGLTANGLTDLFASETDYVHADISSGSSERKKVKWRLQPTDDIFGLEDV